jgi:hypothetical protein
MTMTRSSRTFGRAPTHARRTTRRLVSTAVFAGALVALAACSDAGLVTPEARPSPSAPSLLTGSLTSASSIPGAKTETFVYDGRARTQSFGEGHSVRFGANSVCDPSASGYGPGTWDLPCAPATAPIIFTVTSWRDADGHARVVFSPDVRFVPGTVETLYLNESVPGTAKKATIFWCSPLLAGGCIDESLLDPTLVTSVSGGQVARRIKHFSGYTTTWGFDGGDSLDAMQAR